MTHCKIVLMREVNELLESPSFTYDSLYKTIHRNEPLSKILNLILPNTTLSVQDFENSNGDISPYQKVFDKHSFLAFKATLELVLSYLENKKTNIIADPVSLLAIQLNYFILNNINSIDPNLLGEFTDRSFFIDKFSDKIHEGSSHQKPKEAIQLNPLSETIVNTEKIGAVTVVDPATWLMRYGFLPGSFIMKMERIGDDSSSGIFFPSEVYIEFTIPNKSSVFKSFSTLELIKNEKDYAFINLLQLGVNGTTAESIILKFPNGKIVSIEIPK